MSNVQTHPVDMKLEVVVIPVADVDRAKEFYQGLGWRLDADLGLTDDFRVVQVTPPSSQCSVIFGKAARGRAPDNSKGSFLVVSDIDAARKDLAAHGIKVSDSFHLDHSEGQVAGPDPERRSYSTYASFEDPDGNRWVLQEIGKRLPGRVDALAFSSVNELASAFRRAEAAHGKYEATLGKRDENWPEWYADFMLKEQRGEDPLTH